MDDINRSISQHIKTGKYYEDAKTWYTSRFISPMSERTYLMILLGFYILALAVSGYYYANTNPAQAQVTYMIPAEDISTTYAVVNPAGDSKEKPQIGITKYILSNYVINRESYSYDAEKIKDQLSFIQYTTVGTEFLKYRTMNSIDNPYSPIMVYQDTHKRSIQVKKVDLLSSSSNVQQAMVYFQANLKNIATNQVISEDFVATINFKIDNIEMLMDLKSKTLGFLVTGYNLRKVTKQVK